MKHAYLNTYQVEEFVRNSIYPINSNLKKFTKKSKNSVSSSKGVTTVYFPNTYIGQTAIVSASAHAYAFDVDQQKALNIIRDLYTQNERKIKLDHSDKLSLKNNYLYSILSVPENFNLIKEDVDIMRKEIEADNMEEGLGFLKPQRPVNAAVIFSGEYELSNEYVLNYGEEPYQAHIEILHKNHSDKVQKTLAELLIANKVVTLFQNLDEEYLYEVLSDTLDTHFLELAQLIDSTLPIYNVKVNNEEKITVTSLV